MYKPSVISVALTLTLVGCAVSPLAQTRHMLSGTPSIQGVLNEQARLMVSVTREQGPRTLAGSYDTVSLTLKNSSLLTQDLSITRTLSNNVASQVFTALRPGPGYTLDVVVNQDNERVGMSHVDTITLSAGVTNRVNVVIGLDNRVTITQSAAQNSVGDISTWIIAKGDHVVLNTGFGMLDAPQLTASGAARLRVKLSPELYPGGLTLATVNLDGSQKTDAFPWDTRVAQGSYDPASLTADNATLGTITFELLTADGKIVGRSEMNKVRVVEGQSLNIELIEATAPSPTPSPSPLPSPSPTTSPSPSSTPTTAPGNTTASLITGLTQPVGVTLDPSGTVYWVEDFGTTVKTWTQAGGISSTPFATNMAGTTDIVRTSTGMFYVCSYSHGVYKIPPGGGVAQLVTSLPAYAVALDVDANDNVYVADSNANCVWKITPTDQVEKLFTLSSANGVAVDAEGNVYASSSAGQRVWKYSTTQSLTQLPDMYSNPAGLTFDNNGNLYVSDYVAGKIYKLPPGGSKQDFATVRGFIVRYDATSNGIYVADYADGIPGAGKIWSIK